MSYKNGESVLPPNLLKEIQKYIQGEIIYIPKRNTERAAWGELSGSKKILFHRNQKIVQLHQDGYSIKEIADHFCLCEDSIKKILIKQQKQA